MYLVSFDTFLQRTVGSPCGEVSLGSRANVQRSPLQSVWAGQRGRDWGQADGPYKQAGKTWPLRPTSDDLTCRNLQGDLNPSVLLLQFVDLWMWRRYWVRTLKGLGGTEGWSVSPAQVVEGSGE